MEPQEQFFQSLVERDFQRMRSAFTRDATARFLLPHGLEEYSDREAITRRFESWFGGADLFELEASDDALVGGRQRLSWRFSVERGIAPEVVEQHAFLKVGAGGIESIDLICSGFQGRASAAAPVTREFDAGGMGCADGLAEEFRRKLGQVAVGESLRVIVRDPAAKEDLPALARLLGQSVTSVEAHEDGRLEIQVEKIK